MKALIHKIAKISLWITGLYWFETVSTTLLDHMVHVRIYDGPHTPLHVILLEFTLKMFLIGAVEYIVFSSTKEK